MNRESKEIISVIAYSVLAIGIIVLFGLIIFHSDSIYKYRGPGPDYPLRSTEARLSHFPFQIQTVIAGRGVYFVELQERVLEGEITAVEAWENIADRWRELYREELFQEALTDGWGRQFVVELNLAFGEQYETVWELYLRSMGPSGIDHGGGGDDIVYGPLRFWVFDQWRYFMEWPNGPQGTERGEIVERIDLTY